MPIYHLPDRKKSRKDKEVDDIVDTVVRKVKSYEAEKDFAMIKFKQKLKDIWKNR